MQQSNGLLRNRVNVHAPVNTSPLLPPASPLQPVQEHAFYIFLFYDTKQFYMLEKIEPKKT